MKEVFIIVYVFFSLHFRFVDNKNEMLDAAMDLPVLMDNDEKYLPWHCGIGDGVDTDPAGVACGGPERLSSGSPVRSKPLVPGDWA